MLARTKPRDRDVPREGMVKGERVEGLPQTLPDPAEHVSALGTVLLGLANVMCDCNHSLPSIRTVSLPFCLLSPIVEVSRAIVGLTSSF